MKYILFNNPRTHRLETVFLNQWSKPIDANIDGEITETDADIIRGKMVKQVTRARLRDKNRDLTDEYSFSAYYQLPPPDRESLLVAGIQYSEAAVTSLVTHSLHSYLIKGYKPKSDTASWGFLSVYLQYWNPYHWFTGYVEVNLRKDGGIEHPMWLAADKTSWLHTRQANGVNSLFARLLVKEMTGYWAHRSQTIIMQLQRDGVIEAKLPTHKKAFSHSNGKEMAQKAQKRPNTTTKRSSLPVPRVTPQLEKTFTA
eukprot:CAMPEP_0185280182 /NCGR_PEP_ID=MMETSP1359-20130426/65487_1 /TAXON_ID=552665 /ORGANISM="Bigelowiella longifila, Strain CCMP242" /LENGTH=255 /DNA_ID=CAMNT_0027875335 /DNA_START=57 /DNA_END=824 /DNA_ORIENTATION=-